MYHILEIKSKILNDISNLKKEKNILSNTLKYLILCLKKEFHTRRVREEEEELCGSGRRLFNWGRSENLMRQTL